MDNSEFMRNGDYTPNRFDAQVDCVNQLFTIKTNRNPESAVGLMSMGGRGPEVLATLTTDHGKILAGIHDTHITGAPHLTTGIQVAALALKHRLNKLQRQRVIVFVGSPVEEDVKALVKLAKKMKKNSVAVDFVNFGEEGENTEKLEKFIEAVNSGDNSHLVTIPPGPHLLSDILRNSPIIKEDDDGMDTSGMGGAPGGSNDADFEFGVDPSVDPELALALRMSLEDEKARLEKEKEQPEKLDSVKEEDVKKEDEDASGEDKGKDKKDDDKMDTSA
jgi:26S proteasome regulatory subunit N10